MLSSAGFLSTEAGLMDTEQRDSVNIQEEKREVRHCLYRKLTLSLSLLIIQFKRFIVGAP